MITDVRQIGHQTTPAERWVRSSRCTPSGNCVELNPDVAGKVGVRDSKAGAAAFLTFGRGSWSAFLGQCRSGA
jgi:hypothetical protein